MKYLKFINKEIFVLPLAIFALAILIILNGYAIAVLDNKNIEEIQEIKKDFQVNFAQDDKNVKEVQEDEKDSQENPVPGPISYARSFGPDYYSYGNKIIKISPDLKRCAFSFFNYYKESSRVKSYQIVLDGRKSEEYNRVSEFIFSPDSKRFAYLAEKGGKQIVVLDGQKSDEYEKIYNITFSPDSKRFAYVAHYKDNKPFVVLDGQKSDSYGENTLVIELAFSPDSKRFSYLAYDEDDKAFIVLDNQENKKEGYNHTTNLVFSPNGEHFAYVARGNYNSRKSVIVLDGVKENKEYDFVSGVLFSLDSEHFMYKAKDDSIKNGDTFVVYNRKEKYEMFGFPVFSEDKQHLAYIAKKGDKKLVVLDGHKNKLYDRIYDLTFSPNGEHFAYIAKEDNIFFIVLDGKEGEKFPWPAHKRYQPASLSVFNLSFSLDSKFFAYCVDIGVNRKEETKFENGNHKFVLLRDLENRTEKRYFNGSSFLFSPDSKYFIYKNNYVENDLELLKSDYRIIVLNNRNNEFKIERNYEGVFNLKFSDDSRHVIYNKEKIISEDSFDIYYIEELIE